MGSKKQLFLFTACLLFRLFLNVKTTNAQNTSANVAVTASVPLSSLWSREIANNTQVAVNAPKLGPNNPISIQVVSKGLDNQILKNQKVTTIIYMENEEVSELSMVSDSLGISKFQYIPQSEGFYSFTFTDNNYEKPVHIKQSLKLEVKTPKTGVWQTIILKFKSLLASISIIG